jgi:hypothetical protein
MRQHIHAAAVNDNGFAAKLRMSKLFIVSDHKVQFAAVYGKAAAVVACRAADD